MLSLLGFLLALVALVQGPTTGAQAQGVAPTVGCERCARVAQPGTGRRCAGGPVTTRAGGTNPPEPGGVPPAPRAVLPRLYPRTAVPSPSAQDGDPEALERRIGERLLLYAGTIVLVLGVAFFLRYAFDHQWMSPPVRILVGGLAGILLVTGGRALARRGFRQYGLFLSGGGLAMLFLSAYAAFAFYALIGRVPAFTLLAVIAIVAAALADREASLPLALMAVCGGFVTPFLVSGGGDAQILLFSYDAVLIAATIYLAHRRGWPWLNLASFALTVVTVAAWADAYYTAETYLRTELFLTLYCAMFVAILRENRRSSDAHAWIVSAVLWCAPALYHITSIAILQAHGVAFLVYVILLTVAVIVASIEASSGALRMIGWVAVTVPLIAWIQLYHVREYLPGAITTSLGIWIIFLVTLVRAARRGDVIAGWDIGVLHASGLGVFAALYVALLGFAESGTIAGTAVALALVNASLWASLRRGPAALPATQQQPSDPATQPPSDPTTQPPSNRATQPPSEHWLGLACALCAIAVAVGFEGQWTVVMWSAEAAVVLAIGARLDRHWFRIAALALFAIAVGQWIQSDPPEHTGPFVVLLNARALAGLVIIALLYSRRMDDARRACTGGRRLDPCARGGAGVGQCADRAADLVGDLLVLGRPTGTQRRRGAGPPSDAVGVVGGVRRRGHRRRDALPLRARAVLCDRALRCDAPEGLCRRHSATRRDLSRRGISRRRRDSLAGVVHVPATRRNQVACSVTYDQGSPVVSREALRRSGRRDRLTGREGGGRQRG